MTGPAPATSVAATEVSFRPVALAGATGAFVLAGAVASLFGPLLVTFAHRFHLSLPTAGQVLTVFAIGDLGGVLLAWLGVKRLPGGLVLSIHLILVAAGAAGVALTHRWVVLLAWLLALGLGFGGLDFGLNTLLARTREEGRASRLNVVNAGFGVGAVVGPLLVIALHPAHYPTLLGGLAVVALVLTTLTRGVHAPALRAEVHQRRLSAMARQRRPILATFIVAYVLYIAVETSATGWMATQLHGEGFAQSTGGFVTAAFWLGVALGRLLGGPLYRRFSDVGMILGGLGAAVALALAALSPTLAPVAYPLMGLALATVFPMGLHWYTVLCPHDSDGLALMILFMFAGGVLGPGAVSLMVSVTSVHLVPLVIALFAAADLGVFASARRFSPLVVPAG